MFRCFEGSHDGTEPFLCQRGALLGVLGALLGVVGALLLGFGTLLLGFGALLCVLQEPFKFGHP